MLWHDGRTERQVLTLKLILLAAPGAGKGTQAENLSKHFGIPTISTGAILRKNIAEGTELGSVAKQYIDDGKFVPDGFPRNLAQADVLDKSDIEIDKVLTIEVDDETIIERLSGRLECEECGTTYHTVYRKPKKEGVCDNCGGKLIVRADDKPEIIKSRLATYHSQTEPLKEFYRAKGMLVTVIGQNGIEKTTEKVLEALEK